MKVTKFEWFLIVFNLLYIIPFTVYYASIKNYEFLGYIAVLVVIFLGIAITLRKTKLDNVILSGLSIWGLLHMAGGGVLVNGAVLYRYIIYEFVRTPDYVILRFDQFVHFYLYVIVAMAAFQILNREVKGKSSAFLIGFFAALTAMGIGGLNEVVEFMMVLFLDQTGVGGYYNTAWDIVANSLGGIVGAIIGYYRYR